ncbi:MAG: hypothetical protein ACI4C1_04740 [Lachnospiraceae bacterium]
MNKKENTIQLEQNKEKSKLQTTKVFAAFLLVFVLVNSILVEAYSMYAMLALNDLSALYVLITTAIGSSFALVLEFGIYSLKSFAETKAEKAQEFEYVKLATEASAQTINETKNIITQAKG